MLLWDRVWSSILLRVYVVVLLIFRVWYIGILSISWCRTDWMVMHSCPCLIIWVLLILTWQRVLLVLCLSLTTLLFDNLIDLTTLRLRVLFVDKLLLICQIDNFTTVNRLVWYTGAVFRLNLGRRGRINFSHSLYSSHKFHVIYRFHRWTVNSLDSPLSRWLCCFL